MGLSAAGRVTLIIRAPVPGGRGTVVFIHPTMSPDPSAHSLGLPDSLLDFPVDTARAVAQMHYHGVFAATPDVKYVVSHAGGVVPYLARRFAIIVKWPSSLTTRGVATAQRPRFGGCPGTPRYRGLTRLFKLCAL
jgi:hypothetical protein